MARLVWISLAIALVAAPAGALIVVSGDGRGNTEPPPDDFGFANVGDAAQTAVYIGRGWVLTASHVPEGPVVLQGVVYEPVAGSKVRMRNDDEHFMADLALFRLREPPDLPSLPIRPTPPEEGDLVFLAGNGFGRGEAVELEGEPGWAWSKDAALRWGTNRVRSVRLMIAIGFGNLTAAFETDFSTRDGTEHEAQVTVGDSGGGAFIKRDGTWELAGILFAENQYDEQPRRTAIAGNLTYVADLSVYRDQIFAAMDCDGDYPCMRQRMARRASSCQSVCGEGFAWSGVVLLLVRPRSTRTWPSWARRRRRPPAPS